MTPKNINTRKVLELNSTTHRNRTTKEMLKLGTCSSDDVTDLNRKEQLRDLEQVPAAPCKTGTVFLSEGMVLDFVTATFIEFDFTTQHNENIQITPTLFLIVVMVKLHMPVKILRNVHKLI